MYHGSWWTPAPPQQTPGPTTPEAPGSSPSLTFCHDALHTDNAAEETGRQRPRRHVLGAEAALQPDVEVLVLLGVGGVDGGDKILQGALEGDQLLKGVAQEPATEGGDDADRSAAPSAFLLNAYPCLHVLCEFTRSKR